PPARPGKPWPRSISRSSASAISRTRSRAARLAAPSRRGRHAPPASVMPRSYPGAGRRAARPLMRSRPAVGDVPPLAEGAAVAVGHVDRAAPGSALGHAGVEAPARHRAQVGVRQAAEGLASHGELAPAVLFTAHRKLVIANTVPRYNQLKSLDLHHRRPASVHAACIPAGGACT